MTLYKRDASKSNNRENKMTARSSSSPESGNQLRESTTSSQATAGRDLDALVAEKVMGYAPIEVLAGTSCAIKMFVRPGRRVETWNAANPRPYSTDIATAMEAVAKLRGQGWVYFTLQSFANAIDGDAPLWDDATMRVEWWAEFSRYRSPVEATSPECDSPVLAICLAALKAVGA